MKPFRRLSRRSLLMLLMGCSLAVSFMGSGVGGRLRGLTQYVLLPLGDVGMYFAADARGNTASLAWWQRLPAADARRIQAENDELRGRLNAVEQELARRIAQDQAVEGLRRLFAPIADVPYELIPARVVAADALPYGKTRMLNAGSSRGVGPGMHVTTRRLVTDRSKALPPGLAVISAAALVGDITESAAFACRLRLVTDSGFEMQAIIRRDLARARQITVTGAAVVEPLSPHNNAPIPVMMRGDGETGIVVPNVAALHNVLSGDLLVTADADSLPQTEVRIGEVTAVETDPQRPHFVTLRVRPFAELDTLREVYVVVPPGRHLVQGGE